MKRVILALLLTCSSLGIVRNALGADSQATPRSCLKIYDATLFQSRPSLEPAGIERASVFDITRALKPSQSKDDIPDEPSIRSWLSRRPALSSLVVLDVEHWPLMGDAQIVEQSLERFRSLLSRTRAVVGPRTIGYYAVLPIRDYWRATDSPSSGRFKSWQADNDKWQRLADDVDAVFPSLYTFYDDEDGWVRYAKANLKEARRLAGNKPVYAFIWPQYHESNKTLGGTFIPGPYWRLQLDTLAQYADGVLIWGGYQIKWDENAAWWQVTREFARSKNCRVPSAPLGVHLETEK